MTASHYSDLFKCFFDQKALISEPQMLLSDDAFVAAETGTCERSTPYLDALICPWSESEDPQRGTK
jgi:hypothetical protein